MIKRKYYWSICMPRMEQSLFFEQLQQNLDSVAYNHMMLLGDFSGTIDNKIDRLNITGKKRMKSGKLPNSFFSLVENEVLSDIWRQRNKGNKDFTFYLNRHKVWSRIDMVWATKVWKLSLEIKKIEIMTRSLSDHSPILCQLRNQQQYYRAWRINEDFLINKK